MNYTFRYHKLSHLPQWDYVELNRETSNMFKELQSIPEPTEDVGYVNRVQVHLIIRSRETNDIVLMEESDKYILELTSRFDVKVIRDESNFYENMLLNIKDKLTDICTNNNLNPDKVGMYSMLVPTAFIRTHNLIFVYTLLLDQEYIEGIKTKAQIMDIRDLHSHKIHGFYIANKSVLEIIKPYKKL